MVHIVAISDQHGALPEIPECDLLIIAGDICPDGSSTEQADWLNIIYRHWLETVPAKEVVGIAGNHDKLFERAPQLIPNGLRWHYLQDSSIELFGLKIYGTPWQLPFWGAFNLKEEALQQKYLNIPSQIDILISHGPPYGIRDEVPDHFSHTLGDPGTINHTGSHALLKRIFELKPRLVVFGHIHCAYGISKQEDIVFVNASVLDNDMEMVNDPLIFDLT